MTISRNDALTAIRSRERPLPDLRGVDLIDADLTYADLSGAVLTGADLRSAVLTGAVLTRADLTDAILTGAVLIGANLRSAYLTDTYLTRAVLTYANLSGAVLTNAVLRSTNLTRADLTNADLTSADLTNADLTSADLTNADLTNADLTDAVLTGVVLTDADLTGAVLTRADLTDAVLTDADLTDAVLTDAVLTGATWDRNTVWPNSFTPSPVDGDLDVIRRRLKATAFDTETRLSLLALAELPSVIRYVHPRATTLVITEIGSDMVIVTVRFTGCGGRPVRIHESPFYNTTIPASSIVLTSLTTPSFLEDGCQLDLDLLTKIPRGWYWPLKGQGDGEAYQEWTPLLLRQAVGHLVAGEES